MGDGSIAQLLERRLSAVLPAGEAVARFARSVPIGARRLERIRFYVGGRLTNVAADCRHVELPGEGTGVLVTIAAPTAARAPLAERARALVEDLANDDCLVAVAGLDGRPLALAGGFDTLAAGEAAIEQLAAAVATSGERLLKRVLRVGDFRRAAGAARFSSEGLDGLLTILGPAERIAFEPEPTAAPAVQMPVVDDLTSIAPMPVPSETAPAVADGPAQPDEAEMAAPDVPSAAETAEAEAEPTLAETIDAPPEAVTARDEDAAVEPAGQNESEAESATDEPVAAEATVTEAPAEAASQPAFAFVAPRGPVRFVFQMDAETRFTFVSADLAAIVGPVAGDIVGKSWAEVAAARGLDGARNLAAVLARRDTWSGVTLEWPADGTRQRVAVDLAALPAFARDRRFEGYRGFGVIRPLERRQEEPEAQPEPEARQETETQPGSAPLAEAVSPAVTSNVVRLPRAAVPAAETERLSVPEQEAFRRIAAALGAEDSARRSSAVREATPASVTEAAPATEPPAAAEPVDVAPVEEPAVPQTHATPAVEPVAEPAAPSAPLEALHAVEQKLVELEAILDTATDGILVVDQDGLVERLNRSAEALFGIETAAVVGHRFTELLAEESRKSALDYLDGLTRNGVASVLNDGREVIGRVPQGGLIPLFMTMGRLPATGKFCAVLRDITQWKNAEEELINARRAAETASMQKSDFLAKISHEIRTPLNAIIGFSEVMMEERFGPIGTERYKEYLRDIHVSGAHLMSLINDLLDLSKIEAGKLDLAFQAVSLNDLVMECVAVMQPQANRERIIIRTSISDQVPNIVADARSIRQIVLNLLSNAVKFTLAGGQVIVSTVMEESGEVTLRIRDTGVGMSASDIETALKPFRQLATSRERRSDGTGLGLPLTKALVEANRAAFAIDSTVGQGTLVRVTFPPTRVLAG
ncbi:MAG: PAS domain S-box protein [Rhizobiales bacterium]|nr:PAS domain S-box protein [Hyphomicrobiales bacterium]